MTFLQKTVVASHSINRIRILWSSHYDIKQTSRYIVEGYMELK